MNKKREFEKAQAEDSPYVHVLKRRYIERKYYDEDYEL